VAELERYVTLAELEEALARFSRRPVGLALGQTIIRTRITAATARHSTHGRKRHSTHGRNVPRQRLCGSLRTATHLGRSMTGSSKIVIRETSPVSNSRIRS
jgi:hypothetical protein